MLLCACLVLAACGGAASKVAVGEVSAASTTTTVLVADTAGYGPVLTNGKGFALYTYTADDPGGPGCTGSCLELWPPLLLASGASTPTGGPGVTGLGTFPRDGGLQVTYHGLPLYTYLDDVRPGLVTGQHVVDSGGTWLLATVASPGAAPAAPTTSGAPPTTATARPAAAPVTSRPVPPTVKAPAPGGPTPTTGAPPHVAPPSSAAPPTTQPATTVAPTTSPPTTVPPGGGVSY